MWTIFCQNIVGQSSEKMDVIARDGEPLPKK